MMTQREWLSQDREPVPAWLAQHEKGRDIDLGALLQSRTVFYPGSGHDGYPVMTFGSAHCAHVFIYVDYGIEASSVRASLDDPAHGFRGYTGLDRVQLPTDWLPNRDWRPPNEDSAPVLGSEHFARVSPYCILELLERRADFDERHGPKRLAILFLGADGIACFDTLYCRGKRRHPYAVVLVDHGFGCNYDRFGRGGLLDKLATRNRIRPAWLACSEVTSPWDGYLPIPGVQPNTGGMHRERRALCSTLIPHGHQSAT